MSVYHFSMKGKSYINNILFLLITYINLVELIEKFGKKLCMNNPIYIKIIHIPLKYRDLVITD